MDDRPERSDDPLLYELVDAIPIGIALEDFEGRLLFVIRALCAFLGFSKGGDGVRSFSHLPEEKNRSNASLAVAAAFYRRNSRIPNRGHHRPRGI